MNELEELSTKELVDQGVYTKVDEAVKVYHKLMDAQAGLSNVEKAIDQWKKKEKSRWELRISVGGMNIVQLDSENTYSNLTGELVAQFLTVLEALYYNERKEAIKEFNKSLEEPKNGSRSSK